MAELPVATALLCVVLAGDARLPDKLRREDLVPLGSRIRARLATEYASREELLSSIADEEMHTLVVENVGVHTFGRAGDFDDDFDDDDLDDEFGDLDDLDDLADDDGGEDDY